MVEYAKNLADFAAASRKKHVVVLSGLDFGRLQRIDMSRYRNIVQKLLFSPSSQVLLLSKVSIPRHLVN